MCVHVYMYVRSYSYICTCVCTYYMYCKINHLIGLPQKERAQLDHIHFLGCSNRVDELALAEPIVDNLLKLEEGTVMYDVCLGQKVLVRAPVLFIIGDNPMCSDLCNHQGSAARKYCRMCMVCDCIDSIFYYCF